MTEPTFGLIPLNLVRASKSNPRKRFDPIKLQELADSIKQSGVGQPILVRPLPNTDDQVNCVEIIAGERRVRASRIVGLTTIPAIVRDMTDVEVRKFQMVENLQREDVHPIEEAEAYDDLMKEFGYTVDKLADEIGKSRAYVYARLKLCALPEEARTVFFDGKLSASTALLIARIPVETLQNKAAHEIIHNNGGSEPMSHRNAIHLIRQRYMLDLDDAPFSIKDAKLVSAAGSCISCPKRTLNNPELFSDLGNADVCTDPDCFESKKIAHNDKLIAAAKKKGVPIYEGAEQHKVMREEGLVNETIGAWTFDRTTSDFRNKSDAIGQLPQELRPEPKAYFVDRDNDVVALFDKTAVQEALEKAGLCLTLAQHEAAMQEKLNDSGDDNTSSKEKERAAKQQENERLAEIETKFRTTLYKQIRSADADGLAVAVLRVVVKEMLYHHSLPDDVLGDLYNGQVGSDEEAEAFFDTCSKVELERIVMDLVMTNAIGVGAWEMSNFNPDDDDNYKALLRLAEAAGIDPAAVRQQTVDAPQKKAAVKKSKAAPAPKPTPANGKKKEPLDPATAWPFPTSKQISGTSA